MNIFKTEVFKNTPKEVFDIAIAISNVGGAAYLVGGYVRDAYFGTQSKDIDIEVFGLQPDVLENILKSFGSVKETGQFKVFKLSTESQEYDVNIPRREEKTGVGYNGFKIEIDPFMTVREAAERRDLTINAIYYNPLTLEINDPFNGVSDIEHKIARHTSLRFSEDPLRVLRVMQFVSRFNLKVSDVTIELCRTLKPEFKHLAKERLWEEFSKLFMKGVSVKKGLIFLKECGWTDCFKGLHDLEVALSWDKALNIVLEISIDNNFYKRTPDTKLLLYLIALGYYMPNPMIFLDQINCPNKIKSEVISIIDVAQDITRQSEMTFGSLRKSLSMLKGSRDILNRFLTSINKWEFCSKFLYYNLEISDESLQPLVVGDDLMELGYVQGKEMGLKLKELYNLQLMYNYSKEELLNLV